MIQFGELTDMEKSVFLEEINKNVDVSPDSQGTVLWPEDDIEEVQKYFNKNKS